MNKVTTQNIRLPFDNTTAAKLFGISHSIQQSLVSFLPDSLIMNALSFDSTNQGWPKEKITSYTTVYSSISYMCAIPTLNPLNINPAGTAMPASLSLCYKCLSSGVLKSFAGSTTAIALKPGSNENIVLRKGTQCSLRRAATLYGHVRYVNTTLY